MHFAQANFFPPEKKHLEAETLPKRLFSQSNAEIYHEQNVGICYFLDVAIQMQNHESVQQDPQTHQTPAFG